MPDRVFDELPRIALVYGREAAAAHVRDAVGEQLQVVYAASAGEFDVARMHGARASAALVNLDDGDWLDAIETRLEQAGIAVVYNDPEISRDLEGWERARWLRHLVAKLRGSSDVDPPRPETARPQAPDTHAIVAPAAQIDAAPEATPHTSDATLAELPLSPEEIETMTVDLVAGRQQSANAIPAEPPALAPAYAPAGLMAMDLAVEEAAASATRAGYLDLADAEPATHAVAQVSLDTDFDAEGLDVDTEALSAMIDARLADSAGETMPSGSPQVWRVAGGAVSPGQPDHAIPPVAAQAMPATPALDAVPDDADLLDSLPSLDDWTLIDPEAPAAPVATRASEAPEPVSFGSFAGLELMPMETVVPVRVNVDPIERWLDDDKSAGTESANAARAGGAKA
jgi:hypothetical protein